MNNLQKWQLEQFCRKHEVDTAEIDTTLTYAEVKKHLESIAVIPAEERLDEWDSVEEFYNSVSIEEQADLERVDREELPYLFFYSLVKFKKKQIVEFRRYADKFDKHINIMYRTYTIKHLPENRQVRRAIGYAYVKGNITTVTAIIDFMKQNGMRVRILKTSLSYEFLKKYRYANGTWYKIENFN